jgi:hypothetical protein
MQAWKIPSSAQRAAAEMAGDDCEVGPWLPGLEAQTWELSFGMVSEIRRSELTAWEILALVIVNCVSRSGVGNMSVAGKTGLRDCLG